MKKDKKTNEIKDKSSNKINCAECGSDNIETSWQAYNFPYGSVEEAIELTCKIPIRKCIECGFSFMDEEAENLCHEAVCKYLNVMNPEQIKSLRKLHNLTQAQFCEITKLGDATLSRWERGLLIQNSAYDNYLYLLGFHENFVRIQNRHETKEAEFEEAMWQPTFREIEITEELRKQEDEFKLRPCEI